MTVVDDDDVQRVTGFILGYSGNEVQLIEFNDDQCGHGTMSRLEFDADIRSGAIITSSEAELVLNLELATLEEMEQIKAECRQYMQTSEFQESEFDHKDCRALRMFQEIEASVEQI